MNIAEQPLTNPVVDVCGKRTLEYVTECLAKFNRGTDLVKLRAIGGSVSKGIEVIQILSSDFDIQVDSVNVQRIEIVGTRVSCLEAALRCDINPSDDKAAFSFPQRSGFIEFPIYHLLLDSLLHQEGSLNISVLNQRQQWERLFTINSTDWDMKCECIPSQLKKMGSSDLKQLPSTFRLKETLEQDKLDLLDKLASAYYRSGLLLSPGWYHIAKHISQFDDVILGVDTNILMDAALTEHLVNSLTLIDPVEYVHTPSWLFIIIPSAVMHELEQRANARDDKGALTERGRLGYRALEEVIDLDQSADLPGLSLTIVGEANPILDTRVELQYLGDEIRGQQQGRTGVRSELLETVPVFKKKKISSGDTIIRDQFKHFLRQIDFHKGIYFLTADKTNHVLAEAEGLHSIYYKRPDRKDVIGEKRLYEISEPETGAITIGVPLGKLIYELTVEFGSIKIAWNAKEIKVECDNWGENLDHWFLKDIKVDKDAVEKLLEGYRGIGRFSLNQVKNFWHEFNKRLAKAGLEEEET